jgi:hypothetical protein
MFVEVELKDDVLVLINKRNVSMIRALVKDGFPTAIIYFCGDEMLELSRNPESSGFTGVVELDDLLQKITDSEGRY